MVISYRVPVGVGIVIPVPITFNMQVFKIPIPIIRNGKIFPPYLPRCGYYLSVSMGAYFFDIPSHDIRHPILEPKMEERRI